jgi:hypothetical protein
MPLRNPGGPSHDEAHTVASHSDTTATGAETETLTDGSNASALHVHTVVSLDTDTTGAELTSLADGSEVSIHSHAGGGLADIPAWAADIRDNYALLALVDGPVPPVANSDVIPLGMEVTIDGSATINAKSTGVELQTGSTGDSRSVVNTPYDVARPDRNAHFVGVLTTRATSSALKAQGFGFHVTGDRPDLYTNTSQGKAMFRSVTTGNLFAVSGASSEETTDLGGSHTLGAAGVFDVFTTNDGSSWLFHIAKSLVATHSTQVPSTTGTLVVFAGIENNTTTNLQMQPIDLLMAWQDRS